MLNEVRSYEKTSPLFIYPKTMSVGFYTYNEFTLFQKTTYFCKRNHDRDYY